MVRQESRKLCQAMYKQLDPDIVNSSSDRYGYMTVRYEVIIEKPLEWALHMYSFAFGEDGLSNSMLEAVENYIRSTSSRSDVAISQSDKNTYSLSKAKMENDLRPDTIKVIESECADTMRSVGYNLSSNIISNLGKVDEGINEVGDEEVKHDSQLKTYVIILQIHMDI